MFIQHANSITTKYLHFTNRTVEQTARGLQVSTRQRQISSKMFEARGSIDSSLFLAGKSAGRLMHHDP